jgi:hypothetical protein
MIETFDTFMHDFAIPATVGGVSVRGIFDATYADPLGMAGNQPVLTVASEDLPSVAVGQAVVLNATAYTVQAIEPDGTGITTLILRRA